MSDRSTPIFEIRDPALDEQAIVEQVLRQVARRRAEGAYGSPMALLEPEPLRPPAPDPEANSQALADLTARANLDSLIFTSSLPVIGPLIAAVRNAWSGIAARWIGQHLAAQQTAFNRGAVRLARNLVVQQSAADLQVQRLQARVAALESRLARLEGREEENAG